MTLTEVQKERIIEIVAMTAKLTKEMKDIQTTQMNLVKTKRDQIQLLKEELEAIIV